MAVGSVGRMAELSMGMRSGDTPSPGGTLSNESNRPGSGATSNNNSMSVYGGGKLGPTTGSDTGMKFNYTPPTNGSVPAKGTPGLRGGMSFGGGGLFNKTR